jgi:hypothetical protein
MGVKAWIEDGEGISQGEQKMLKRANEILGFAGAT